MGVNMRSFLNVLCCSAVLSTSLASCTKTSPSVAQNSTAPSARQYGAPATLSSLRILSEVENSDREMSDQVFKNLIHLTRLHDKLVKNNLEDTHNFYPDVRHNKIAVSFPLESDNDVINPDAKQKPKQDDEIVKSILKDMLGYKCQMYHALTRIIKDENRKKVLLDVTERFLKDNQLTFDSAGLGYFHAVRLVRDGQDLRKSSLYKNAACLF